MGMIESSSSPQLSQYMTEFLKNVLEKYPQIPFQRLFLDYLETMMKDFMSIQIIKQFQLTIFKEFFQDFQENIEFLLQTLELLKENVFSRVVDNPTLSSPAPSAENAADENGELKK